jgi:hypothetical protein
MGAALMRFCNRFSRVSAFVSAAVAASPVTSPAFSAECREDWDLFILVAPFNNFDIPQHFINPDPEVEREI